MHRAARRVDGQRLVVRAQAVAVGVGVREDPCLQHLVGAGANAGYQVAGRHGHLLDLGEVVLGVAVQLHHAHLDQRVVGVRPDLGQVEGVVGCLLGVSLGHDLDIQRPFRKFAALDGVEEILLVAFAGLADEGLGLFVGEGAMALLHLEVEFHPEAFALGIPETVGVAAVAVHEARAGRDAPVAHQDGDLVQGFGRQAPEVPGGRGAAQVGARMALLRVDEVGELERIADEEDRRVVAHQIPVALVGVELHGKAAHVTLGVGRAHLSGHGGKARDQRRDLAHFREDAGTGVARDVLGDGEGAEGAPALGVDDALGDALTVLVGQLLQQVPVLHQHRAARAGGQAVLVVDHRGTGRGGHDGTSQGGVLGHGLFSVEVVGIPAHRDAGKGDVFVDAGTLRSAGQ